MNTSTVTITREDAIKYYKKGGILKELALQAFPNMEEIINEEKILFAKKDEIRKQETLNNLSKLYIEGSLLRCGNGFNFYEVVSSAYFISKNRVGIDIINVDDKCYTRKYILVFDFSKSKKDNRTINDYTKWTISQDTKNFGYTTTWWHFWERDIRVMPEEECKIVINREYLEKIRAKESEITFLNREINKLKNQQEGAITRLGLLKNGTWR